MKTQYTSFLLSLLLIITSTLHTLATPCWKEVSGGYGFTLALADDGTLWTWGSNSYGQLGNGTTTASLVPIQIGSANDWLTAKASCGGDHSLAIKTDGTLWSWGRNSFGQLGNGTTTASLVPAQIGTGHTWIAISCGAHSSTAIRSDSTLWSWGWNYFGMVGNGTTSNVTLPTQIGSAHWKHISSGCGYHTMGVQSNGSLWTWGRNQWGQLGDNTTVDKYSPVQIGNATDWARAFGGGSHSVAQKISGAIWAWGWNGYGMLGIGSTTNYLYPVVASGATDWAQISVGGNHNVAIKTNGSLWTWGYNQNGELGNGSTTMRTVPTQVGVNEWGVCGTGGNHSIGIKNDGSLWTWGYNLSGQIGDSTTVNKTTPTLIVETCVTPCMPPSNQQTTYTATSATVSWDAVPGAIEYRIMGQRGTQAPQYFVTTNTTRTFGSAIIKPSKTYQWSVQTHCADGTWSDYSAVYTFTTPAAVTYNTEARNAAAITDIQVAPNPATDEIRVTVPTQQDGVLKVYDITGREVYTNTISHTTTIPVQVWNNGLFVVQVQVGTELYTTRFVKQ